MVGARRWFVMVVGVALACLGTALLTQERTFRSAWQTDAGPEGIDTVLLIDTRGAPLAIEGTRDEQSQAPEGDVGPGYVVRIAASAGVGPSLSVRLVSPSGAAVWAEELPRHGRALLVPTVLDEAGIWRLEVRSPARIGHVWLDGEFRASPWPRVLTGAALPIAWILCGGVAALAVSFGTIGARIAVGTLVAAALSIPIAHGSLWILESWPGLWWILGLWLLLTATAGVLLGWTRPAEEGPPPSRAHVVVATVGAATVVLLLVPGLDLPCGRSYCAPLRWDADNTLAVVGAFAGLCTLFVGAELVGRRSARREEGALRAVLLDAIGTLFVIAAPLVLGAGVVLAVIAGTGIGFADQGPDTGASFVLAAIALVVTAVLLVAARLSFRLARPRGGPDAPGPRAPVASRP